MIFEKIYWSDEIGWWNAVCIVFCSDMTDGPQNQTWFDPKPNVVKGRVVLPVIHRMFKHKSSELI